jgi:succinate dehydrogenase / fumarate reductase flavoprotein subunit
VIEERYGNLFEMYERITDEDPYVVPMRIYPRVHYTMGGLWVDYNLMSNVPGLYVLGEANFADQGANRSARSALMQGSPTATSCSRTRSATTSRRCSARSRARRRPRVQDARRRRRPRRQMLSINGNRTVDDFHRELGKVCGTTAAWRAAREPRQGARAIPALRDEFWKDVARRSARASRSTSRLEKAGRVADFSSSASCCASTRCTARRAAVALPRRAPDRGRRGAARRRQFAYARRGSNTGGRPARAELHKDAARVRERAILAQRSYKRSSSR